MLASTAFTDDSQGEIVDRSLDQIDRSLIALLRANAREPAASLARKLELSRSAVQERLARLARAGVIAGYTVTLGKDMAEPGLRAIVRFTMDPKHTPQVVKALRKFPEAEACFTTSGAFDLIVIVGAASAARLHEVLQAFGNLTGVERTTASIVLVNEFDNR